MTRLLSIRRVAVVIASVSLFTVTGAASAADREVKEFEACGFAQIISVEGNLLTALLCGQSTPGGEFVGIVQAELVAGGVATGHADVWLMYEDGSTFAFKYAAGVAYSVAGDTSFGLEFGGWRAIDGSGQFDGVISGGGSFRAEFLSEDEAVFDQIGTIVFRR
jgi:hypothetical protein